ncbi:divergent polysaccharide deacetylase family protein [Pararhodospirillum oryzae]|uniref:Divergent polysaccharide deacetylase family protein n=1 Tax=Pararhodospirillum oryzae TaxID=478448 RepID=A0A512H8H8_9PROT|nr:divergent polysaccharide deacetylase family protein [Pararhodospirillum oryzae]GEO81700.1 hypothetical protein ROR02_18310 [Pararhodospirillum oryzae]
MAKGPSRSRRLASDEDDDEDDFGFGGGRERLLDNDEDRSSGRAGGGVLLWAGLATILGGGLIGAWLLVAGEAPPPVAPPSGGEAGASAVTRTLPPPGSAGDLTRLREASLMSPPGLEDSGHSMERRPWLSETGPDTPAPESASSAGTPGDHATAASPPPSSPPSPPSPSSSPLSRHAPPADAPASPGPEPQAGAAPAPAPVHGDQAPAPAHADAPATAPESPSLARALPAMAAGGAAGEPAGLSRPSARLLPAAPAGAEPPVPALPVEEGYRPGRMPRFSDLPPPGSLGAQPLPDAPLTSLLRASDQGLLPVIAQDGRMAWRTYARPFEGNPSAPRIAIVVTGLGMRSPATRAAITQLPPDVTLAFSPYAPNLPVWMGQARQAGHETVLELPVESVGFPATDPGQLGLLSIVSELENRKRLESTLASAGGYVGLIATNVGRVTNSAASMRPILEVLKERGLLYVHRGEAQAVNTNADVAPPVNVVTTVIDSPPFQRAIDLRLTALEDAARAQGFAVGTLSASPLALYRLTQWLGTLEKRGFALAPVSAVMLTSQETSSR